MKQARTLKAWVILGSLVFASLVVAQDQVSKDCAACTNTCDTAADKCKLSACQLAGGHSQLQSGGCFNIPPLGGKTWMEGLSRCETKQRTCRNTCKASNYCKQ